MSRGALGAAAALLLIAASQSAMSYSYMCANGWFARPMPCDAAGYRLDALAHREAYERAGVIGLLSAAAAHDKSHPPLVVAVAGVVAAHVDPEGVSPFSGWLTIQLFGALFLVGTYRLARNFGGRATALAAVAMTASMPLFIVQLRPLYPQFPMAALCTWTLDLLVRSDRFSRVGMSAAAGAALGLAILAKMLAPLYVGGAAVVLLFAGIRSLSTRRRSLLGAAAFLATSAAVAASWYAFHGARTLEYADRVIGAGGQASFSRGLAFADPARWTYFLRAFIDEGIGLPTAVLTVVAAATVLAGRRRKAAADPAATPAGTPPIGTPKVDGVETGALAAAVVLAYPVLSLGQIAGESFYLVSWAPLVGVLLAVRAARARTATRRTVAAAALIAVALGNHALCARDFLSDRAWPGERAWCGVSPVARYDSFMYGHFASAGGAVPRPEAESWPGSEFAAAMLRTAPRARPRFVGTSWHPFCDDQILEYEARIRRGSTEPYVAAWVLTESLTTTVERLRLLDFVVLHERPAWPGEFLPTLEQLAAAAAAAGREARLLLQSRPSPAIGFSLVQLATPGSAHGFVGREAIDARDVVRRDVTFADGPTLRGYARRATPDGAPMFALYFDARAPSPVGAKAVVELRDGRKVVARAEAALRSRPAAAVDAALAAVTVEFPSTARSFIAAEAVLVVRGADDRPLPSSEADVRLAPPK